MGIGKFKTEKVLFASVGVLFLFLFASAFTKEITGVNVSSADESSGASGSSEASQDSGGLQGSEESQDETSEESQDSEKSEPSVSSTSSVAKVRTMLNTQELSTKSSSEVSQQSMEEISEVSEISEYSQEISEESIKYVEGYGDVISRNGNIALVKKDEKLFFLIPVEIESQVTLGEQGEVIDSKTSFLNWILSVFSF